VVFSEAVARYRHTAAGTDHRQRDPLCHVPERLGHEHTDLPLHGAIGRPGQRWHCRCFSSIDLNGGTITDVPGNDAVLTFTPPDTSGVLVDGVAPTITSVTGPAAGTYIVGQNLDFTVQFDDTVVVDTARRGCN
jgi:hypothetical protein